MTNVILGSNTRRMHSPFMQAEMTWEAVRSIRPVTDGSVRFGAEVASAKRIPVKD